MSQSLTVASLVIREQPIEPSTIINEYDVARTTAYRALNQLDEEGAVKRTDDGYVAVLTEDAAEAATIRQPPATEPPTDEPTGTDEQPVSELDGYIRADDQAHRDLIRYANDVIYGGEWDIDADDVGLSRIFFTINPRPESRHGYGGALSGSKWEHDEADCLVELTENTYEYDIDWRQTVRHELVHVLQYQEGYSVRHDNESFKLYDGKLELGGSCSFAASEIPVEVCTEYYTYPVWCPNCDEIRAGKSRYCRSVRSAAKGHWNCSCGNTLYLLNGENMALVPDRAVRTSTGDELKMKIEDFAAGGTQHATHYDEIEVDDDVE